MSEEIYNTAKAWEELKRAGLANATAQDLVNVGMGEAAKRMELMADQSMVVAQNEENATLETIKLGASLETLATIIAGPVSAAWEAFGTGSEDAVKDMLYNMVASGEAMENMGTVGTDALAALGDEWGLTDQMTRNALHSIQLWQEELANTGDIDKFNTRLDNLRGYLEGSAEAAFEAKENIVEMIEASSRDIASPMEAFRKDIEWFVAGGGEIAAKFQEILAALTEGKITPTQAHEMIGPLIVAAKDLQVEIGHESLENASASLATALGVGVEEAAEMITGSEGITGALQSLEDVSVQIGVFEELNADVEESGVNIDGLIARPNVVKMDDSRIHAADQSTQTLYDSLEVLTKKDWTIKIKKQDFNIPGGGGGGGGGGHKKDPNLPSGYTPAQQGISDFIVPPGFYEPQNPFLVGASSGEEINIEKAGAVAPRGGEEFNINMHNQIASYFDIEEMADLLVGAIRDRMH